MKSCSINFKHAILDSVNEIIKVEDIKYNDNIYRKVDRDKRLKNKVKRAINTNESIGKIFVNKKEDGSFELISGIKSVLILKQLGNEYVNVYVNDIKTHKEFINKYDIKFIKNKIPKNTQEIIYFSDIIIPSYMAKPNFSKVIDKFHEFKSNNGIINPVSVIKKDDGRYLLKNGLISYNYLRKCGEEWIPCTIK